LSIDVPPTPFYSLLLEAHAGRLVHRQDLPEVSMIDASQWKLKSRSTMPVRTWSDGQGKLLKLIEDSLQVDDANVSLCCCSYSGVAFTWQLCIWYLWRAILTSGLCGIGLTAGVSSCCCLETLIYLSSIFAPVLYITIWLAFLFERWYFLVIHI
jgi:hypothetical protein